MDQVLSEKEVDSLLSGTSAGKIQTSEIPGEGKTAGRELVIFDFRLPRRISKNQLRALQAIHENFAEALGSYLVSRLHTTIAINVTSVNQLFYSEFIQSITGVSYLNIFRIVQSEGLAILELSPQLVMAMVERLLGGGTEGEKKARPITRIEQNIVKAIVSHALTELQSSWKSIANLTFKWERYESEADFAQIAPASEIVLVVSFEVCIGEEKYSMNLCFPTFALEEDLERLNIENFSGGSPRRSSSETSETILKRLEPTRVSATGILGSSSLTLREFLQLRVGDVLKTSTPDNGEVEIRFGGHPMLWGSPGISNGRIAVKITRIATEHELGKE